MTADHRHDAHRHLGVLPAHPFYGGPPVRADITARATVAELFADLDAEGTERALVLPNYGVPVPEIAFGFNELVLDAASKDDRVRCGLWVSARAEDADRTAQALSLAGEPGVVTTPCSADRSGAVIGAYVPNRCASWALDRTPSFR